MRNVPQSGRGPLGGHAFIVYSSQFSGPIRRHLSPTLSPLFRGGQVVENAARELCPITAREAYPWARTKLSLESGVRMLSY